MRNNNPATQLGAFAVVSMISTVVDYGLLGLLHHWFPLHASYLLAAVAIAYASGVLVHFSLARRYVFAPSQLVAPLEFTLVVCIGLMGLILTEALVFAGMVLCGFHLFFAKSIAVVGVFGWNFFARRCWVYPA